MPIRKWYFAANQNGLQNAWDQISVAVASARAKTSLQPICLVDEKAELSAIGDKIRKLESWGVTVLRRQPSLFEIVRSQFGEGADVFSGHWLRCDIPLIETVDEFVLYTDIDVMFRAEVTDTLQRPRTIACAPEHRQDDFGYFNSGVMIMNLPQLRATRDDFIHCLRTRLSNMAPHDDQGAFNVCYRETWERLPNSWNWKPYWGFSADATIVHFHGPKPTHVRHFMHGAQPSIFGSELLEIFQRNPEAYARYMAEFNGLAEKI